MNFAIEGIEKLTEEQKKLMFEVNALQTSCVGNDYKAGMQIVKAWVNDKDIVCVRLLNGDWYHYTTAYKWYQKGDRDG